MVSLCCGVFLFLFVCLCICCSFLPSPPSCNSPFRARRDCLLYRDMHPYPPLSAWFMCSQKGNEYLKLLFRNPAALGRDELFVRF